MKLFKKEKNLQKTKKLNCRRKSEIIITLDKIRVNNLFKRVIELKHNIAMKKFKEKFEIEKKDKISTPEFYFYKISELINDYMKREKKFILEENKIKEERNKFNRPTRNFSDYCVKEKVNSHHTINDTVNKIKITLDNFKHRINQIKNNSQNTLFYKKGKNITINLSKEQKETKETKEATNKKNKNLSTRNSNCLSTNNIKETNQSTNIKSNRMKTSFFTLNKQKHSFNTKIKLTKNKVINQPFYTAKIKDFVNEFNRIKKENMKNRAFHKKFHFLSYEQIDKMMDNIYEMKINNLKQKFINSNFPTKKVKKSFSIQELKTKIKNQFSRYEDFNHNWINYEKNNNSDNDNNEENNF